MAACSAVLLTDRCCPMVSGFCCDDAGLHGLVDGLLKIWAPAVWLRGRYVPASCNVGFGVMASLIGRGPQPTMHPLHSSHNSADHHPRQLPAATPHLIRGRWGCGRSTPAPLPHPIGRAPTRTAPTTPPAPTTATPTTCSPRAEYMYEISSASTNESAASF